jgi:iron complex outermembrane receptor protein
MSQRNKDATATCLITMNGGVAVRMTMAAAMLMAVVSLTARAGDPPVTPHLGRMQTDIPPLALAEALRAFAQSRHIQIVYVSQELGNRRTEGVHGDLSAEDALSALLEGTNLEFKFLDNQTVAIEPRSGRGDDGAGTADTAGKPAGPDQGRSPPRAAPGADEANFLQEVLVTASRRTESQLDVPMSLVVISRQTLEEQGVQTFDDFANQIPNLTFNYGETGGDINDRAIAIRGIQGADTTSVYMDDLPMPISLDPRILDLQRIEVLRGPQGTLYGARSMGGTVREITTPPDLTEATGSVHSAGLSIDGGGDGYQLDGTFNLPLVLDRVALRLTPFSGEDPGYINREFPDPVVPDRLTVVKNTAAMKYQGVIASLLWKAADNLAIRPTIMYQSSRANGFPLADYSAGNLTNFRHFDLPESAMDKWLYAGGTVNYSTPYGVITSATSLLDRHSLDVEDVSEYTASSAAFNTPLLPSTEPTTRLTHSATEEIRFASAWGGPVQFVGGLYYNLTDYTDEYQQIIPQFQAIFGSVNAYSQWQPQRDTQRAVYGELTYSLGPQWSATFGGRYTRDDALAWGDESGVATGSLTGGISLASRGTDGVFTPKYLLKYQPNGNLDVYADIAKGYRPGSGETPPPPIFCATEYRADGLTPADLSYYKPDSLWSYEVGEKLRSTDQRFSLDGSLFWIDWKNIRETIDLACGFFAYINSAAARSRGGELEASAAPFKGLMLNGGVGYTDAKIVSEGAIDVPPVGSPIEQVAPLTGNFSARYEHPWVENTDLLWRLDYIYTSHSYSTTNSPLMPRLRPAYRLVGIRSGIRRDSLECAFFIKNLFDVHPNLGDQLSNGAEDPGRPRWETGPPRTYGVDIRARF